MDLKGIHQLLLSPIFPLNHILAIFVPGALLLLLLGFNGNETLRNAWLNAPFGYKTKLAGFVLVASCVGSVLRTTFYVSRLFKKKNDPDNVRVVSDPSEKSILMGQTPEVRKMLIGIIGDGVLLSTPGLLDRLSLIQADAGFHVGTGVA